MTRRARAAKAAGPRRELLELEVDPDDDAGIAEIAAAIAALVVSGKKAPGAGRAKSSARGTAKKSEKPKRKRTARRKTAAKK